MSRNSKKRRIKGTGHVYQRESGNYHLQYIVNGKRKNLSLGTANRKEAEKKAKELLEPVKNLQTKEEVLFHAAKARKLFKSGRFKLSDIWEKFENHPSRNECSEDTQRRYKSRIESFIDWVNSNYSDAQTMSEINDNIAQEYAKNLASTGITAKTYNDIISNLRTVFKIFSNEAGLSSNPFRSENIASKTRESISKKEFSEEEVLKILHSFKDIKLKDINELEVLFHIGAWTGLRLKDCCLLKWENISFKDNTINCVPSKTRKHHVSVTIPLHEWLREKLEEALEWKKDEFVLPHIAERYNYNSDAIGKPIGKILKHNDFKTTASKKDNRMVKANLYGFHSLRHSFVSFCAKYGVPLSLVQEIVGHKNPAMTKHYTHFDNQTRQKAINSLPSVSMIDSPNSKMAKRRRAIELLGKASENSLDKVIEILIQETENKQLAQ
jgi:integrase